MQKAMASRIFLVVVMGFLLSIDMILANQPQRDFSPMENRTLTTTASLEWGDFSIRRITENVQNFITDQVPGRDAWMQMQAVADASLLRAQRNGIIFGKENRLFEDTSTWRSDVLTANVSAVDQMAGLIDAPVSLMLVPTSAAVYPQDVPYWIPVEDQAGRIASLYGLLEHTQSVDVLRVLLVPSDSALYYRTDHHWTAEGAQRVYAALRDHYGIQTVPEAQARNRIEVPAFFGSYYAHAPSHWISPDTFSVDLYEDLTLWIDGKKMPGLLNAEQAAARDKYAAVLYGNHGRTTLYNEDAAGGCLVVLQDSYANAVLPSLAQHFQRIETVDLRYFSGDLMSFLNETEADQILCIYGLSTLVGDRSLLLQSALWPS